MRGGEGARLKLEKGMLGQMKGIWIASADCAKSLEDLESERVFTRFVVAL